MSKPTYEFKVTEGVTEYFKDGEKIAFINDQGTLCATHGNASEKEALKAWIDRNAEKESAPETDLAAAPDPFEEESPLNKQEESAAVPEFIHPPDADPVNVHEHELDRSPTPQPGTARFEFSQPDAPVSPIPVRSGPPAVPEKQPRLIPGLGYHAPDYLWWAWHQPDDVFLQIYGKSKAQFEEDHGGYLEKIRNRSVNGGLQ